MPVNQDDKFVEYWDTPLTAQIASMAISNKGKILFNDGNSANPTYMLDRQSGAIINPSGFTSVGHYIFPREKTSLISAAYLNGANLEIRTAQINSDSYTLGLAVSIGACLSIYGATYSLSVANLRCLYKQDATPTFISLAGGALNTLYQNEVSQTNPESMTPLHNYGNGCMRTMIDISYALFNYGDSTNPYWNLYVIPSGGYIWSNLYTNYPDNSLNNSIFIHHNIVSFEVDYQGTIIALAVDRTDTTTSEIRILRINTNGILVTDVLVDTITDDTNIQFNGDALAYDGDELFCINLRDKVGSDYYNYIYVGDIYEGKILNKYIPPTTTTTVNYGIALHIGGSRFACTYNHNKIMII